MAGSKLTWASSCWRSWALTAHRFAAWRVKVVRWTRERAGNQSRQWRRKCSYRPLVGVDAEELADALDGQDLTVAQDRLGAALAEPPTGQPVIDQAVHRDEQRHSIHARPPYAW
jgi:hypothetical protein